MEFLRKNDLRDAEAAERVMKRPEFRLGTLVQFCLDGLESKPMRTALRKSITTFPFIAHVACPLCVALSAKEESPSSSINSKFRQLAMEASPSLYHSILKEAHNESV
jgi:hypothetical protein